MIIEKVPKEFQPNYNSNYPQYSSGKNMEEIFFDMFQKNKDNIKTEYIYLPVFWTSYYLLNNYGKNISPLYNWLESLNTKKKYFTIVQYASGIFLNNTNNLNITVFSAGGGGINSRTNFEKEVNTSYGKRVIFIGNKGDYDIPLICQPSFPNTNEEKKIFCSFMGRFDTHPLRFKLKKILRKKISFFSSSNFLKYKNIVNSSTFTLSPRGYGYTSFRIYEAILAESIPIYIWDDKKVLPFQDELNWEEFSIIIHYSEIKNLLEIIGKSNIEEKKKKLKEVKHLFTFEETFNYIIRKII